MDADGVRAALALSIPFLLANDEIKGEIVQAFPKYTRGFRRYDGIKVKMLESMSDSIASQVKLSFRLGKIHKISVNELGKIWSMVLPQINPVINRIVKDGGAWKNDIKDIADLLDEEYDEEEIW